MNKIKVVEDMILLRQLQREYLEFLDDEQKGNGKYHARTKAMIEQGERRLVIDINDLRKKFPLRAASLLDYSLVEIGACQKAVKEYVAILDPKYAKNVGEFLLGFEGNFGSNHLTPRYLTSFFLETLVCVEGIVTKCSVSKLKIVRSVHYCPTTGKFMERKYTDVTSMDAFPSSIAYPTKDEQGNLLETEFGLSTYKDHQTLTIQEMPEKAPPGQLPRTVDIICDNDLVDLCKPGDRVKVIGCYRCLPGKYNSYTTGIFRTVIIANSILPFSPEEVYNFTKDDMNNFRAISRRRDVFDLMSNSIAPSIHGHEYIKKAILCMLLGGSERILANGTRLRGDINLLMIGDPGVAKSQLLRYVLQAAPRAIPTTGRGSSGVGLTAAVTTDPETGERRLEAGAMVLADRGVVCIDEFDKMSDMDRTAIHEVMEQGKVTISKAGIHARLNARCSVLAAANPVYGKYDQYKTPMQNIGLQDSLLSRFDLLFVLLDIVDTEDDKRIADHVVRMHRYRSPREQAGEVLPMGAPVDLIPEEKNDKEVENDGNDDEAVDEDELVRKGIFEKYNPILHGAHRSKKEKILTMDFIKKYVFLCKSLKPVLSEAAAQIIAEEYTRLRSQDAQSADVARTQPITARTLETLIRLATARAKVRISRKVNAEDARTAIELVQYAIFKKVLDKKEKKKRQRNEDEEKEVEAVSEEDAERAKRQKSVPVDEFENISQEEQTPTLAELRQRSRLRREKGYSIPEEKLKSFKDVLVKIFMETRMDSIALDSLMDLLSAKSQTFTREEVEACLEILYEQNHVMLSGNIIYLI